MRLLFVPRCSQFRSVFPTSPQSVSVETVFGGAAWQSLNVRARSNSGCAPSRRPRHGSVSVATDECHRLRWPWSRADEGTECEDRFAISDLSVGVVNEVRQDREADLHLTGIGSSGRAAGAGNIYGYAGHAAAGLGMIPMPLAEVAVDQRAVSPLPAEFPGRQGRFAHHAHNDRHRPSRAPASSGRGVTEARRQSWARL